MTRVAMYREDAADDMPFRALAGRNQAMGRTAGEALNALTTQLPAADAETLIIVPTWVPTDSSPSKGSGWSTSWTPGERLATGVRPSRPSNRPSWNYW